MTVRENVRLHLAPSVVEVVACWLSVGRREVETLRGYLSPDECARADRFIAEGARDRFVVAGGRLRQLLGDLCGCPPPDVRFAVAEGGKPRLADPGRRLRFNVAHSNDLMLCAVTLDHEVGIDVEHVRQDFDYEGLARRFFAEDEVRALAAVPSALARDAFFACWTRKEAVIKATGEGMARSLGSFAVSVDPAHGVMLSADPALGRPEEWSLLPVPLPPAYRAPSPSARESRSACRGFSSLRRSRVEGRGAGPGRPREPDGRRPRRVATPRSVV